MALKSGATTMSTSRAPGKEVLGDTQLSYQSPSSSDLEDFAPDIVIDCAYVTREQIGEYGLSEFVKANRQLQEKFQFVTKLPSVRTSITFSSGAVMNPHDRYGALKKDLEQSAYGLESLSRGIVIPRVWSVSGSLATKPNVFALTNFISQALSDGKISIQADHDVYRRYVSIEDVLAVAIAKSEAGQVQIFDSGGELLELQQVAEVISNFIDKDIKIDRASKSLGADDDHYYSNNSDWVTAAESLQLEPEKISAQVERMIANRSAWMR